MVISTAPKIGNKRRVAACSPAAVAVAVGTGLLVTLTAFSIMNDHDRQLSRQAYAELADIQRTAIQHGVRIHVEALKPLQASRAATGAIDRRQFRDLAQLLTSGLP